MTARPCFDGVDGLPRVKTVTHHYCEDCGLPVVWTRNGFIHDPLVTEVLA